MLATAARPCTARDWVVSRSRHPEQIMAAQALRAEVGPRQGQLFQGRDVDEFDSLSDHILVRRQGRLLGAGRLLPPGRSRLLRLESSFQLGGLASIREAVVELSGVTILPSSSGAEDALAADALDYVRQTGGRFLLTTAAWRGLPPDQVTPASPFQVRPVLPWLGPTAPAGAPDAMLTAYLGRGWQICGEAACDPLTGDVEVPLLWDEDRGY